jgi:hypothetical protein
VHSRCHSCAHSVAGGQHVGRATLAAVTQLSLLALALGAASPAAATENAASVALPAAPAKPASDYPGVLSVAYLVAPLFALAVGGGLSEVGASDEVAVAAASTMFLAPMAVHLYHGTSDRSVISLVSMAGITLAGALAGGVVGHFGNTLTCDPNQDSECDDRGIGTTIGGAVIGSMLGYVASAVLDVAFRSSAPEATLSAGAAQVWLAPLGPSSALADRATRRSAAPRPLEEGLLMGVTLRL